MGQETSPTGCVVANWSTWRQNQTVAGQAAGHWRYPNTRCMGRWGGSDDWSSRLLFVPREDDDKKYKVYYIGYLSAGENNILTTLKGGELMKECYDRNTGNLG